MAWRAKSPGRTPTSERAAPQDNPWHHILLSYIDNMPRPTARRPTPIVLPNCPMDTLWEVDETADAEPRPSGSRPRQELRSVFEDDDDDVRNAFPLPPVSLPVRRFFSLPRMSLPIHSPPKRVPKYNTPPRPPRAASRPIIPFPRVPSPAAQRPVSPTSSASSSDTEPPRTPPAASSPLPAPKRKPAYVLAPPPPAEWESAIDALFDLDEEPPVRAKSRPRSSTPTPRRSPPREPESYISFSPVEDSGFPLSPSSDEFVLSPTSTDFCSAIGFASVWDSSYNRPLTSPGLTPTPVSPPARPRRVPERKSIPVQLIVS